jgi:hypothetical protein
MTWGDILDGAAKGRPGFKELKKLFGDHRFDR